MRVIREDLPHHLFLERVFRGDAEPVARQRYGVIHTQRLSIATRTSWQRAEAIQPCRSSSFHGMSTFFRSDQREHVILPAIFAHECSRQAQPPAGLQPGGHLEHGRGSRWTSS